MYQFHLGTDEMSLILAPRWGDLGVYGQIGLLALLLLVPLGLILWLSRFELRLIPRLHATGLLTLRLSILVMLWAVVGLQPHLVDVRVEETPSKVRVAVDLSSSLDVTDAEQPFSRKETIRRLLAPDGLNLLQRLGERHQVEIVGFHQQAFELQPGQLLEKLAIDKSSQEIFATDFNLPLAKIAAGKDAKLTGIVLFSDGQHNVGTPPVARADELSKLGVPIYPVVIGPREPPSDLAILDVQAPTKVFKNAEVSIEIRGKITNMPAQEITVEMQIEGKPVQPEHRRVIEHAGRDNVFSVSFQTKMETIGAHAVQIKALSKEQKEITLANNVVTRIIGVTEDKARVLLIDGEARWEYHYLANALLRDPTVALERVVFTQPRIGALKDDQFDQAGLPKTKLPQPSTDRTEHDPLLDYDCILLGDVDPEQLPLADRKRLERYVAERGGALIFVAGKRFLPLEYVKADKAGDDPLVKMLPLTEPFALAKETGFTLRVAPEGRARPFLQLEPETPNAPWPELPKHYWAIVGKRKPAASVLLAPALSGNPDSEKDAGVLLQQNYGFGRVLFSGLDSTWRWRFRVGDAYHHRFWGQLVRWSAADRLLPAGNQLVRYGPREPVYAEGQEVELAVRAGETLPPLKDGKAQAKLLRKHADGSEELVAVVPLQANPRQTNLLEAKVRDLPAGAYRMVVDIPAYREALAAPKAGKEQSAPGRDWFRVLPRDNRELLDLSANWLLMQTLADRSDGKLYTPENVEELLDRLARRIERTEHREETRPWQDEPMVWWLLGLLLGLLTMEWAWRKWLDLP
jgi:hypothetical protein